MEYASKINKEDIIYLDDSVIHLSIHDAVLHSLHKKFDIFISKIFEIYFNFFLLFY